MKQIHYKQTHVILTILILLSGCNEDPLYPVAGFSPNVYIPGFKSYLDASESFSNYNSSNRLSYRWDFDGDKENWDSPWLNEPVYTACIPNFLGESFLGLQVKDTLDNITEIYKLIYGSTNLNQQISNIVLNNGNLQEVINYKYLQCYWLAEELFFENGEGIVNTPDSTAGSYFTWQKANENFSNEIHLPSLDDWQSLIEAYNGIGLAGFNLATKLDHSITLTYSGWYYENRVNEKDTSGYYWTSTQANENHAYAIKITNGKDEVEIIELPKEYLLSVRLFNKYEE